MNDFRYKLARFFNGRTGPDNLGRATIWTALILMILTMITGSNILYLMAMALLIYSIWRMFSKNYQKRYLENQSFLCKTAGIRRTVSSLGYKIRHAYDKLKYDINQRKTYAIFYCPNCKQKLRVPKGHKKIQVTCSRCRTQFIKRI